MILYPNISPIAISLGPLQVHWYGLMYLVSFSGGWCLAIYRAKKSYGLWNIEHMSDLLFYIALGVIIGGRVGYVIFYNFDYFFHNPFWLFHIWEGGMSFHGGFLGVLLTVWLFGRNMRKNFFQITDFIAPIVSFGLGIGRLGNFLEGELWGRITDVPWAMIFPMDPLQLPRHPSQLYQFVLEGVILFGTMWWFSSKPRPRMAISGLFLLIYVIGRFCVEFVREPDQQLGFIAFDWLTMGQLLSTPMFFLGIILTVVAYQKYPLINGQNQDDLYRLQLDSTKSIQNKRS